MSIRLKLTLLFLALAIAPLVLISAVIFHNYKGSIEASRVSALRDIAVYKADKMEMFFENLRKFIGVVQGCQAIRQNLPVLREYLLRPDSLEFDEAREAIDCTLTGMQSSLGLLDIMLLDPEGKVLYSSNQKHSSKEFGRELPYFHGDESSVRFSEVFRHSLNTDRLGMLAMGPVFGDKGALAGQIVLEADVEDMFRLIEERTGLGDTGETLIVRKDGGKVFFMSPLRFDPYAAFKKTITIGGKLGLSGAGGGHGPLRRRDLDRLQGQGGSCGVEADSVHRLGMVAKIDTEEAFADVTRLERISAVILVVVSALAGAAAFFMAKSISTPIHKLSEGMRMLGSGRLDFKVGTDSKDEIGELSRIFDRMLEDLKAVTASRDELNREIEARRRTEKSLLTSEKRYRELFDGMTEGFALHDIICDESGRPFDYRFLEVNPAFESLTGLKRADVLYKTHSEVLPGDDPNLTEQYAKVALTGEPASFEYFSPALKKYYHAFAYSPSPRQFAVIFVDITERKNAEDLMKLDKKTLEKIVSDRSDELLAVQMELERAKRLSDVGMLASTVAHELRNPLAAINMSAALIRGLADGPKVEKQLDAIEKMVMESDQIINNLLFYSRLKPPRREDVEIYDLLEECVESMGRQFGPAIAFEMDCGPLEGLTLTADPRQLREVFINLLHNAADSMQEKGGTVEMRAALHSASVEIDIIDEGCGIEGGHMDKIFDPFFTTKAKGTGLGLTVCRQILDMHKGSIFVESEPGTGTKVKVVLQRNG